MNSKRPLVAVTVLICRNSRILFGKRKNAHGDGTWAPPAGHLEFKESIFDCAIREVLEETGLQIKNLTQGPYTNDYYADIDQQYINIYVIADYDSGEAEILEPDRCETWQWVSWDALPQPLSVSIQNLLATGFKPDDSTI